jgi:AcrR family transcriptional regulator
MAKLEEIRAVPQQERSHKRYQAILDAAAEVFAERGVEAATTQEIAERADTSIGSFYRFFADKQALFQAVVDRVAAAERELLEAVFVGAFDEPLTTLIDRVVDIYATYNANEPGWYAIWNHLNLYGSTRGQNSGLRTEQLRRLQMLIGYYAPHLDETRRKVLATTVLSLLTAMLAAAESQPSPMREHLLEETKRLLKLYAQNYLGT